MLKFNNNEQSFNQILHRKNPKILDILTQGQKSASTFLKIYTEYFPDCVY